jgi:TolB protein
MMMNARLKTRSMAGVVLALFLLLASACGAPQEDAVPAVNPAVEGTLAALTTHVAYLATRVGDVAQRVPITPGTPTRTPIAPPGGGQWTTYLNPYLKVRLDYPAHWLFVPGYGTVETGEKFAAEDGFFILGAMGSPGDAIDEVALREAQHELQPYGSEAKVETLVVDGQEARLVLPSADQAAGMMRQALLLVRYPQPVNIAGSPAQFLALYADQDHIQALAQTLQFEMDALPSATAPPPTPVPPVPTSTAVPPGTTLEPPTIVSFTMDPTEVDPGGSVQLAWKTEGAVEVVIQQWLPADTLREGLAVPPNGSTSVTIYDTERYWHTFKLLASNAAGQTSELSLTVQIRCPDPYFFEPPPQSAYGDPSCPYRPAATTWAAEQPFERGRMIWLEGIPAQSTANGQSQGPTIYVLYTDGSWQKYADTWTEDQPESDPSIVPPQGVYQPIRGFGKLWRTTPEVRDRLGWALAAEKGFNSTFQVGWRPYYLVGATFVRTLDGSVAALGVMGGWEMMP